MWENDKFPHEPKKPNQGGDANKFDSELLLFQNKHFLLSTDLMDPISIEWLTVACFRILFDSVEDARLLKNLKHSYEQFIECGIRESLIVVTRKAFNNVFIRFSTIHCCRKLAFLINKLLIKTAIQIEIVGWPWAGISIIFRVIEDFLRFSVTFAPSNHRKRYQKVCGSCAAAKQLLNRLIIACNFA